MKDFYQYLARKFTPHKPIIAILTESNTSYGQGPDDSSDFKRKQGYCIPSKSDPCILKLPFPLHRGERHPRGSFPAAFAEPAGRR